MDSHLRAEPVVRFGDFEANLRTDELRRNGRKVKLGNQSFQILALLLEHPGELVTREELRQKLWPADTFVDFEAGLNTAIKRLRDALGDSAEAPRFVETLPRHGYRLVAPIESDGREAAVAVPATAPDTRSGRQSQLQRWTMASAVAVALLGVLVAFTVGSWRERLLGRNTPEIRSIVVLPLENLTGDPAQEYFVDGMTDALTTDLAEMGALRVISRTSAMRYKGTTKSLPEVARELHVDAVVEGAVARSGNRVRISAQLVQAPNDRHLWAASYERDVGDVLILQDEVASAIAGQIRLKLSAQVEARRTQNRQMSPDAYDEYLLGRFYWNKWTPQGFQMAREHFQAAVEKDPSFAAAYAGLSDTYRLLSLQGFTPPKESMPLAEAAAVKALELDDTLAEAHASLAAVRYRYRWNYEESEKEFRRALELNPNYAEGHRMYGVFLRTLGRYDDALVQARQALELDPLSLIAHADLVATLVFSGRAGEASAQLQKALELDPNFPPANYWLGYVREVQGDWVGAIEAYEKATQSSDSPWYLAALGHAYAEAGKPAEAERVRKELDTLFRRRRYVSPYHMAYVELGLGHRRQALDWLEKAYRERSFELITIYTRKEFAPLRAEPQFQDLLRRLGLPPQTAKKAEGRPGGSAGGASQ